MQIHRIVFIAALMLAGGSSAVLAAQSLPYATGFEAPIHTIGLAPAEGWITSEPTSAVVQSAVTYDGAAALEILTGGSVDQTFDAEGEEIVWIDGYERGEGSVDVPNVAELTSGSALVAFTLTSGVVCFDGSGDGFNGDWIETGDLLDPNQWYRITLKLNFTSKSYDIYVNSVLRGQGIGFLYADTPQLSGFSASAGHASTYVDNIRLQVTEPEGIGVTLPTPTPTTPPPTVIATPSPTPTPGMDTDGDGKPDDCETADIPTLILGVMTNVLLADSDQDGLLDGQETVEASCVGAGTPLAATNPRNRDSDGDGFLDGMEVLILNTDPNDPNDPDPNAPEYADADGDGWPAGLDGDDTNPDMDGDGFKDGYEVVVGSDPADGNSIPTLGDINSDSMSNNMDAIYLFNFTLGNVGQPASLSDGDINGDGIVNNLDAIILFNWTLGIPATLPL